MESYNIQLIFPSLIHQYTYKSIKKREIINFAYQLKKDDPKGLDKCWYSFKRSPSENNVVRINTFFGNAKKHPNWERDQEILNKENEERPKRKKTELLNDIFEAALRGDEDSYAEDFAEMEFRFRRKSNDIAIDLLKLLRDKFTNKVYLVTDY